MAAGTTPAFYVKIWGILLVLFAISVLGPLAEIKALTLITAFGIAIVKAWIVANYFMHLNIEKKYISLLLVTMLLLMAVFFGGTMVDVMGPKGTNWDKSGTVQGEVSEEDAGHN